MIRLIPLSAVIIALFWLAGPMLFIVWLALGLAFAPLLGRIIKGR